MWRGANKLSKGEGNVSGLSVFLADKDPPLFGGRSPRFAKRPRSEAERGLWGAARNPASAGAEESLSFYVTLRYLKNLSNKS